MGWAFHYVVCNSRGRKKQRKPVEAWGWRTRGQILGRFDEMSTLYGLYKHASTMDRKTRGPEIASAFSFEMLNSDDADGLNDRQLFDFPPETLLNELVVPMPKSILNASAEMYTVRAVSHMSRCWCRTRMCRAAMIVHCLEQAIGIEDDACPH